MSNATDRPYHLFYNKAIERSLFIELLQLIDASGAFKNLSTYRYVGFAGATWGEFREIATRFGLRKMVSVEHDLDTAHRQKFNKPYSFMKVHHGNIMDFLTQDSSTANNIYWLDYTSPKELQEQIEQYTSVIEKSLNGDIIKITLNAECSSLGCEDASHMERSAKRFEKLRSRIQPSLIPSWGDASYITLAKYPELLRGILQNAVERACQPSTFDFIPLSSFIYKDGQQMLTLCGVIVDKNETAIRDRLYKKLSAWEFLLKEKWRSKSTKINVPIVTLREQAALDSFGNTKHTCPARLSYLDNEKVKDYLKYMRYYPQFVKVIV